MLNNLREPVAGLFASNDDERVRYVSTSEILTYLRCREEHRLNYVDGYEAREQAEILRFGTVMHAGRGAYWATKNIDAAMLELNKSAAEEGLDDFEIVRAEVMMLGYHTRWSEDHQSITTLMVEKPFRIQRLDIQDPYAIVGIIDSGGSIKGEDFVSEFKTTNEDLTPGSDYWAKLTMDWQVSIYALAAPSLGLIPDKCLYDVARKPELRPLKSTPEDKRKYKKGTGELYANQRAYDETPGEFRDRLIAEVSEKPEAYFGRAFVVRLQHELERAVRDVDTIAADLFRTEPNEPQPRTPSSCRRYGSRCPFWGPCTGTGSLDSDHFVKLNRRAR